MARDLYFEHSMARSLRVGLTKSDQRFETMKDEMRLIICPQCWRATDELAEFWGVKVNIVGERC